jgi:hypothetical protein
LEKSATGGAELRFLAREPVGPMKTTPLDEMVSCVNVVLWKGKTNGRVTVSRLSSPASAHSCDGLLSSITSLAYSPTLVPKISTAEKGGGVVPEKSVKPRPSGKRTPMTCSPPYAGHEMQWMRVLPLVLMPISKVTRVDGEPTCGTLSKRTMKRPE